MLKCHLGKACRVQRQKFTSAKCEGSQEDRSGKEELEGVPCVSLGRSSELQTLHYPSARATHPTKHQNRVFTGWTNEYLLHFVPVIPRDHPYTHLQRLDNALVR